MKSAGEEMLLPAEHQDPDKWAGDPEYYPKRVRELEESVRDLEVKAARWDKLWKLRQVKPNADPQGFRALFSFMSFCTQEEGEAALDAIEGE